MLDDLKYCPRCGAPLRTLTREGESRIGCSDPECGYVFWDNPVPVVGGFVELDGRFVLARNALWPEDRFSMITGYLEAGEHPDIAMARELKEELGLELESLQWLGHFINPSKNLLLIAYHIRALGNPAPGEEIAEIRYCSVSDLVATIHPELSLSREIAGILTSRLQPTA